MKSGESKLFYHRFFCIAVLTVLALVFLFPVAARAEEAAAEEESIRVLLSTGSTRKLTVDVEGQYVCGDRTFVGGTLTVTVQKDKIRVRHSTLGNLASGDTVCIERQEETIWAAFLTLENTRYGRCRYLGDMVFSVNGNGDLRAVNRVDMHAYLYGVVGGELRNTHPIEALKAQAVAAKCFALTCLDAQSPYDVDDTPTDQVYKGYHPAHERVIAAVDAVADDVLLYEGNIVRCYYCTSNGGQTITPLMRWGNSSEQDAVFSMAYDPYDLEGSENAVTLRILPDAAALPDVLKSCLLQLAKAEDPAIAQLDTVLSLVGLHDRYDPDGTYDAPAALAPQSWIEAALACRKADGTPTTVRCGFPLDLFLTEGILSAPDADTQYLRPEADGSWTVVFAQAIGHRVGMSHVGLLQRAEAGFSYDEILACYYPGATLVRGQSDASSGASTPLSLTPEPAPTAAPSPAPTATPEPALIPYEEEPSLWERIFGD